MSDVIFKVSEQTFGEVFNLLYPGQKKSFKGESPGSEDAGIKTSESSTGTKKTTTYLNVPVPWFAVDGEIHLVAANGIEFNDGNTFTISELDIAWDKLILKVGLDIPAMKFGGVLFDTSAGGRAFFRWEMCALDSADPSIHQDTRH